MVDHNQSAMNRRDFVKTSAIATGVGLGYWVGGQAAPDSKSANEKLNIAIIGAGGKGGHNLGQVSKTENIVALCDADFGRAKGAFKKFPKAKQYHDFRKMFDEMAKDIDAVVVSTPDHTHAPAAVMAMKNKKHVYCEKPLTHSIREARTMKKVAKEMGVATQMGNQGHSNDAAREVVEIVQSGAIGNVKEIHAWTDRPARFWQQPQPITNPGDKAPEGLDFDVWLGPAAERPYNKNYLPFRWRGWWHFGTGSLGDMGCHVLDVAFWACKLENPTTIEANFPQDYNNPEVMKQTGPKSSTVTFQFPKRGEMAPSCTLTWYDGTRRPNPELVGEKKVPGNGSILVGDKGTIYIPTTYGSGYKLLPRDKFEDYKKPEATIRRSADHHKDWIQACKGGPAACSNFDYAASLTETILLGCVAQYAGEKVEWDAENMKITNSSKENIFVQREYRKGWTL